MHLAHEEDPHPDQQDNRPPGDEEGEPDTAIVLGTGIDRHPFGAQIGNQPEIIRSVGLEGSIILHLPFDIRSLNDDLFDLTFGHGRDKVGIGQDLNLLLFIGDHVVKEDHDQKDDQPKCKIFIELIQGNPRTR